MDVADDDETMQTYEAAPPVVKKSQRKKGAGSGDHNGLGGRPRKLGRYNKKMGGVKQGLGRW